MWGWSLSILAYCDGLCVPRLSLGVVFVNGVMPTMSRVGVSGVGKMGDVFSLT